MKILRQERHTVCFIEFEVSDLFIDLFLTYYLVNTRAILLVNFPQFYNDLLQDVNSATNVHHNLQGAVIPSSGSIGMRIQYPFLYYQYPRCFLSDFAPLTCSLSKTGCSTGNYTRPFCLNACICKCTMIFFLFYCL